jgi:hypothetical protein
MTITAHRQRLARFIDLALTPQIWHGYRLAAIPIPRAVLATCSDAMRDLAAALRNEQLSVAPSTLRELERVLTHGAESPLYDHSHPIRALHTLVAFESRFGQSSISAA